MRSIEISEETFKRLRLAARSDETSELVIKRLLNSTGRQDKQPRKDKVNDAPSSKHLQSDSQQIPLQKLREYGKGLKQKESALPLNTPKEDERIQLFELNTLPHSVTHTKIFEATLNGRSVENARSGWTPLICEILKVMHDNGQFFETNHYPNINVRSGRKTDKGYKFIPEINSSVQNVDANAALRCISNLAHKHSISLDLLIGWRDKKGALYPAKFGRIIINHKGS